MKTFIVAAVAGVTIAAAASFNTSRQVAAQAPQTTASQTASHAPSATVTVRPTPPPEPIPPTPGPPSPTPALPEDGGPPGGVLAGHLYVDADRSGGFTTEDRPAPGTVQIRGLDLIDGGYPYTFFAEADLAGHWEMRAVPDGHYRVTWEPSPALPQDEWQLTIPPVEAINLNPADTVHDNVVNVITRTVEIKGANRILDIDFGIPPQPPVPGASGAPQLPPTGSGGGSAASLWLLYGVIALSAALGLGGAVLHQRVNPRE